VPKRYLQGPNHKTRANYDNRYKVYCNIFQ
jgi:hypothetical protein